MEIEIGFNDLGNIVVQGAYDGWQRAKFEKSIQTITARRVDPDGKDQIQITVSVENIFKSGASRKMSGSITLTPEQFQQIAEHLSKPWEGLKR